MKKITIWESLFIIFKLKLDFVVGIGYHLSIGGSRKRFILPHVVVLPLSTSTNMNVDAIKSLLLRRRGLVYTNESQKPKEDDSHQLDYLQSRLLEMGYLLSSELHHRFLEMELDHFLEISSWMIGEIRNERGAKRPYVPLFRSFPKNIPSDTQVLYFRRLAALLSVSPEQPCPICGKIGKVSMVNLCGHLVCAECWDGSAYDGCPICRRRITLEGPFVRKSPPRPPDNDEEYTLELLQPGSNLEASAGQLLQSLLSRQTPLSPQHHDDLFQLVPAMGINACLQWLPETIPVDEVRAEFFGTLLRDRNFIKRILQDCAVHFRTATDILRVLWVLMDGDPRFVKKPRLKRTLIRSLRRGVMDILENLKLEHLVEDILRHRSLWKRMGEKLHPFDYAKSHPKATLAFAVLRKTKLVPDQPYTESLRAQVREYPQSLKIRNDKIYFKSRGGRVEDALIEKNFQEAVFLVKQRPGELMRRLDHLLRLAVEHAPESITAIRDAVETEVSKTSTPILLTLLPHLQNRFEPLAKRVFFPRGSVASSWAIRDERLGLPQKIVAPFVELLEEELLKRAAGAPGFSRSVIDTGLSNILVPYTERTAARSLVSVSRGSTAVIPEGKTIRLFLHWLEAPHRRADLDLSAAFYDEQWQFKGNCDYTFLKYAEGAAVHSGDLTDAPPPDGASEFMDLRLDELEKAGVHYIVTIVFSDNDVPFDELPEAFAGFMVCGENQENSFNAAAVEQRFDLQGNAKILIPLLIDVPKRQMRWVDVNMPSHLMYHSVGGYRGRLAFLGSDLTEYFGASPRMSMWTLSCLHAAARSPEVVVTDMSNPGSDAGIYRRGAEESAVSFYHRIRQAGELHHMGAGPDEKGTYTQSDEPVFLASVKDTIDVADKSDVYLLRRQNVSGEKVNLLSAPDLVASLKQY
ncbi:MAG: hypothetical protein GY765_28045 [bacterium]|nr:hypothetical protein [bacterium]